MILLSFAYDVAHAYDHIMTTSLTGKPNKGRRGEEARKTLLYMKN